MARVRQRRTPSGSGTKRRTRIWARSHNTIAVVGGTNHVVRPLADFRTEFGTNRGPVGITVAGGWLQQVFTGADTLVGQARISVGIIVADEDMTTQVPSPVDDQHVDWMWYQTFYVDSAAKPATFLDGSEGPMQAWRAKRRMDELGMDLFLAVQASGSGDYQVNMSTLLLLP